jgi:hypothetical protein
MIDEPSYPPSGPMHRDVKAILYFYLEVQILS